ncbi:hypothetical protein QYF36_025366 [Acer negundo]|nr:hypothetical protein QYF36_025366 [Acer negundo]
MSQIDDHIVCEEWLPIKLLWINHIVCEEWLPIKLLWIKGTIQLLRMRACHHWLPTLNVLHTRKSSAREREHCPVCLTFIHALWGCLSIKKFRKQCGFMQGIGFADSMTFVLARFSWVRSRFWLLLYGKYDTDYRINKLIKWSMP